MACGYCGHEFTPSPDSRTTPLYCSPAHRQAAYQQRRSRHFAELEIAANGYRQILDELVADPHVGELVADRLIEIDRRIRVRRRVLRSTRPDRP